jgi:hypothetical protein
MGFQSVDTVDACIFKGIAARSRAGACTRVVRGLAETMVWRKQRARFDHLLESMAVSVLSFGRE